MSCHSEPFVDKSPQDKLREESHVFPTTEIATLRLAMITLPVIARSVSDVAISFYVLSF